MNISITEYAKMRGISRQCAWKAIKKGHQSPGVKSVKKVGKVFVLNLEKEFATKFQK